MNKTSEHILRLCMEAATLRVSIPDKLAYPGDDSSDCDVLMFKRENADAAALNTDKEIKVFVTSVIHDSDHSKVYLGLFKGVQVVLKCCYNVEFFRDFHVEAKIYEKRLGELQGKVVPSFFGHYLAVDEVYGPYSLLLLEYCGERLPLLFRDLSIKVRLHILNMLGKFHRQSELHPSDFAERNVVYRKSKFRLIDFHDYESHDCDWTEDVDWQVGEYDLDVRKNFPCLELADVAMHMKIWSDESSEMVSIYGRYVPASEFPPQHIIDKLTTGRFLSSAQNWEWIEKYMREIKKEFDVEGPAFDIDKRVAERPDPPLHPKW